MAKTFKQLLSELSGEKLGRYITKASDDMARQSADRANMPSAAKWWKHSVKIRNRKAGIKKAVDRLKHEYEYSTRPPSSQAYKKWGPYKMYGRYKAESVELSEQRSLSEIAREIRKDWGSKVNYAAKPYLDAMGSLDSINDMYYQDSAKSVVAYFLSNAQTWRGDTAKRVKAELKGMLKSAKGRW